MSDATKDIVAKLWNQCHVLRDTGASYHQYVSELTYLLFLKMAQETGSESELPERYRWADIEKREGVDQLNFYKELLLHLGTKSANPRVLAIYANASTVIREPRHLKIVVDAIDGLDWFSAKRDGMGDLYEGLLEKTANEKKSVAGQYFTPRPLIDSIVHLVQPQPGELVQDPAAGTGGFLIAADQYIKAQTHNLDDLTTRQQEFQISRAFYGVELVQDTHRLALMNLMLHDIQSPLELGDAMTSTGEQLPRADVILTNPPFGTKTGGGPPTRSDFTFRTSNKQLNFLQHVYRNLKPGGRAAVVLPDNVLFEEGVGRDIRKDFLEKCDVHTILRLPTGIFYAAGVKTNVVFFSRGRTDKGNTTAIWVYDARTNMPSFGKRTPFVRDEHLGPFEAAFGGDRMGHALRVDEGETGRWRRFGRAEIAARGDNLDIAWLKDDATHAADELVEPGQIVDQILEHLQIAVGEIEALKRDLEVAG